MAARSVTTRSVRRSAALTALLAAGLGVTQGSALAAPSVPATPTVTVTQGHQNPPALWMMLVSPTPEQVAYAPSHYRVVVLNPWETAAMRSIKAANPAVTVLAYKDLSSSRSYAVDAQGRDAAFLPIGVGYAEAEKAAGEQWFAHAADGSRVQWGPYPGHYQMALWDAGYRARWVSNVVSEITAQGWDGVMADNDLAGLGYYFQGTLVGGRTDTDVRSGVRALIDQAGTALAAKGKVLVPNITEGRLDGTRWQQDAVYGGGLEEQFVHWGNGVGTGYIGDWGPTGWDGQALEAATATAAGGQTLAITHADPSDHRTQLFGLASFWVTSGGRGAWTSTMVDGYTGTPFLAEQALDLGTPVTDVQRQGGARTRTFTGGFAAANPTATPVTVTTPAGTVDAAGTPVTSVVLGAYSGTVLRSVATQAAPVLQKPVLQRSAVDAGQPVAATAARSTSRTARPARVLPSDTTTAPAQLAFRVR